MTNQEFDFETWFDHLAMMVLDLSAFALRDPDCVREDYEQGRNLADEIGRASCRERVSLNV